MTPQHSSEKGTRLLIVAPSFPHWDKHAGYLRLWEIIRILSGHGYRITFLAHSDKDQKYRQALEALGVECVTNTDNSLLNKTSGFRDFLVQRGFNTAILVFYSMYNIYAPFLRAFLPRCRLILDTVDLNYLRVRREAALDSNPVLYQRAAEMHREEASAILNADNVWVVTEKERQTILRDVSDSLVVHVVPLIHRPETNIPGYSHREGIVFIGNYLHRPNEDGVRHFMKDIYPVLRIILPNVRITLAGAHPPSDFHDYQRTDSDVVITGYVKDHRELLLSHRVGIAPLRYGAGMKGKIAEYMACGLPVVTSSIGAEGMDLREGYDGLIADEPGDFARAITRLYFDSTLWQTLSQAGVEYIGRRLCPELVGPRVLEAVCCAQGTLRQRSPSSLIRFVKLVSIPRHLRRLAASAIGALRDGGMSELRSRAKVWASRT